MTNPTKDIARITAMTAALHIGIDLAHEPDRTAYWPLPRKAKAPNPKKRAKIKAARKQRNAQ